MARTNVYTMGYWINTKFMHQCCFYTDRSSHNDTWSCHNGILLSYNDNCLHNTKSGLFIIIKRGRQCKAEREWYTPYQSEDPAAPQYQPLDRKERKGKIGEDYRRDRAAYENKKVLPDTTSTSLLRQLSTITFYNPKHF